MHKRILARVLWFANVCVVCCRVNKILPSAYEEGPRVTLMTMEVTKAHLRQVIQLVNPFKVFRSFYVCLEKFFFSDFEASVKSLQHYYHYYLFIIIHRNGFDEYMKMDMVFWYALVAILKVELK